MPTHEKTQGKKNSEHIWEELYSAIHTDHFFVEVRLLMSLASIFALQ